MAAKDAHLHGSTYYNHRHHRSSAHHHRSRHPKTSKRGHFVRRLVLNLCLLTAGCVLLGTAFHYYYRGEFEESKSTPESVIRTERDYFRAVVCSLTGLVPLALGIRGEVLRKRAQNNRVRARAKASRSKNLWPEDQ